MPQPRDPVNVNDRFSALKAEYEKNGPEPSNMRYGYVRGRINHAVFLNAATLSFPRRTKSPARGMRPAERSAPQSTSANALHQPVGLMSPSTTLLVAVRVTLVDGAVGADACLPECVVLREGGRRDGGQGNRTG
jgi:hypothetical protein